MSYPHNIALDDLYYDPVQMAADHELSYMLSFDSNRTGESNVNITEKSIHLSPRDTYESPLQTYSYIDFTKETYDKLHQQSQEELRTKVHEATKGIRGGFKEYFVRSASKTLDALLHNHNNDYFPQADFTLNMTSIIEQLSNEYKIESMRGNLPAKWPEGLHDFQEELNKMPITAFSSEATAIVKDFLSKVESAITKHLLHKPNASILSDMLSVMLGVAFRTTNYYLIANSLFFLYSCQKKMDETLNREVTAHLSKFSDGLLKDIFNLPRQAPLQYMKSMADLGGFAILKKFHFQKQNYFYNTMTTDGNYIYLYICCNNGVMMKIGTGHGNTIAGKIYVCVPLTTTTQPTKIQEVMWVYVKGKIYLRAGNKDTNNKDAKNLEVIDPETLKSQGTIQLHCPALFGHPTIHNINKGNPMLSDGEYLYIIGKRFAVEKLPDLQKPVEEPVPVQAPPAAEETEKEKKKKQKIIKKKERKRNHEQANNTIKLIEYVLYQFDVSCIASQDNSDHSQDNELVNELYKSFNQFYTLSECRRALLLAKDDMNAAALHLVTEGENQRNRKIIPCQKSVVLAQAEVTNDAHQKQLKAVSQIGVRQDSILTPQNITQFIWTCCKNQVACYTDSGIKVFSKSQADYKPLPSKNEQTQKYRLGGTFLGHVQSQKRVNFRRFHKNPEYLITYDNFNKKYYSFSWPDSNRAFPALISVSRDYVDYQQKIAKTYKPISVNVTNTQSLALHLFNELLRLEDRRLELPAQPNNWLYIYSCVAIDINNKIGAMKPQEAENKKKLTNKRNKIISKMNRILELEQTYQHESSQMTRFERAAREVKMEQAFCINGRVRTVEIIDQMMGDSEEYQQLYFSLLNTWVVQADKLLYDSFESLSKIGDKLLKKLKMLKEGSCYDQLLSVLTRGFYVFLPRQDQQYAFLLSLNKIELLDLVDIHFRTCSSRSTPQLSFIKNINKEHIVQKYENNSNFNAIFLDQDYEDTTHSKIANNIGNLLLDNMQQPQLDKKDPQFMSKSRSVTAGNKALKDQLMQKISNGLMEESEEMFIFYKTLLTKAIIHVKEFSNQTFQIKHLTQIIYENLRLIDQVLQKLPTKSQAPIIKLAFLLVQVYLASRVSLSPPQHIISAINMLLQNLLKPELVSLMNNVHFYRLEGISQTYEKIFQTNHPYDRSHKQVFQTQSFQNAIIMALDFDKRSQTDGSNDVMAIWSTSQTQPLRENNTNYEPLRSHLRMSGKLGKRTYLMLGNNISLEFTSSGQAKDEHSLNRYGYRVGVRPVYSGKIQYDKQDKKQAKNRYGSIENFESLVMFLKLLTTAGSISAQNLLNEEKLTKEEQLGQYLEGKVLQQGLEQNIIRNVESYENTQRLNIINNFMNKQHRDKYRAIVKELLNINVSKVEESKPKPQQPQADLWDLTGIPQHIKPYIEEIKNYRGNFINLFLQARSQVMDHHLFKAQTKRQSFTEQYKKLWMMGQALLFLTVLKHSGLLQLSLEFSIEYIKENLQAFQQARNGAVTFFIRRMQVARKWDNLLNMYHRKEEEEKEEEQVVEEKKIKDQKLTVKKAGKKIKVKVGSAVPKKQQIKEQPKENKKVKIDPSVSIRQELTDPQVVKDLLKYKKLPVSEDNIDNISEVIEYLKKHKPTEKSVYEEPALHLIKTCMFLLRLKSNNNREELSLMNLKPPAVTRSISDDDRRIDNNKVVVFREWLENWKKWKGFNRQEKVQLKFPVKEIVEFIKGYIDLNDMKEVMLQRSRRVTKRTEMIQQLHSLTKIVQGTLLEKYVLGTIGGLLKQGVNHRLDGTSESVRKNLDTAYQQYTTTLNSLVEQKKFQISLTTFRQMMQKKAPFNLMQKLKSMATQHVLLFSDMTKVPLDALMYYITFRFMSTSNEQLIQLANRIIYKAQMSDYTIQQISEALWKEVGRDTLSMRRWKDVVFLERLHFLLMKAQSNLRQGLEIDTKLKLAQCLFYVAYHIEAPLINKLALRVLRKLELRRSQKVPTPYDIDYVQFKESNRDKIRVLTAETYHHKTDQKLSNWELLSRRCGQNFLCQRQEIKQKLLPKVSKDRKRYMLLHLMSADQDLSWLINVFYYLEELYPTMKTIGNYEEYLAQKKKKDEEKVKKEEEKKEVSGTPQTKFDEKLLANCPENIEISEQMESKLPVCWFLSFNNSYREFKAQKIQLTKKQSREQNRPPNPPNNNPNNRRGGQPSQKKGPPSVNLLKLLKKYEQLNAKPLEEPKEADPADQKEEFVKAKNFISRMRKHCNDANNLMQKLVNCGYTTFLDLDETKTEIICQIIQLAKHNRLQQIPCQFTKKDYKAKLAPGDIVPTGNTSDIRIEFVDADFYSTFQHMLDMGDQTIRDNNYSDANRYETIFNDNQQMSWEELPDEIEALQEDFGQLGKELVESGWFRQKRKMHQVKIRDFDDPLYYIAHGGADTGTTKCHIISNNDTTMTHQTISPESLVVKSNTKATMDRDELMEQLKQLLEKKLPTIGNIQECQPYMQLKCILSKACKLDWSLEQDSPELRQFVQKLTELSKRAATKKTVKQYDEQLQKLMNEVREKTVDGLQVVSFYDRVTSVHEKLEKYVIAHSDSQQQIELQDKFESISSHMMPSSNYLSSIDMQLPQIEENKLLKYWEKIILPRIQEFVKSSFKPLQIEEYFEQMRIPLRKYDQFEAMKVAYVLCENKLPAGAVFLEPNHDWDSLTIEQAHVGRFALLKLPKSVTESSSPILKAQGVDQLSLVQIVFADSKTNSVLVRRRLTTHSILHYIWVPVSSLLAVQMPIHKLSNQKLFKSIQQCLNGTICGYSKLLLTKLSEIVKVDSIGLIRQNIMDRYVKDPVKGWLNDPRQWTIQPLIEKMLEEKDLKIIEMIESELKPFKAYDADLFTNYLKKLNIFPSASSLIVSFKKTTKMAVYSGVRFYNDEVGFKEAAHVYTPKSERNIFEPIIIKSPNVYSKFYTNKDCLPLHEQSDSPSKIDATLYGIEPIWTIAGFLAEKISAIACEQANHIDILSRINKIIIGWLLNPGSFVLRETMASLVIRITNRIVMIAKKQNIPITLEVLGATKERLDRICGIVKELNDQESKQLIILYSPFLQTLSEMLATIIGSSQTKYECPTYIKELIDTSNICRYVLRESNKWGAGVNASIDIVDEPNPQWERFMIVEDLPEDLPAEKILSKVKETLKAYKARVLTPALDVYYEGGKVIALVDGWDVAELAEQEVMEKIEEEEEKQPEEEQALMSNWACQSCTFENVPGVDTCEMCGIAAPAEKPAEVFEKVESADLAAAEKKLRDKESKRFEEVKKEIINFVEAFNKEKVDKINKANEQIKQRNAQREEEAKKKEEKMQKKKKKDKKTDKEQLIPQKTQEKLLEIPELKSCKITTGSEVLKSTAIEGFLKKRLQPTETCKYLHKILADCPEDMSFLDKFKLLESKGYDLWGVQVSSPKATLLPYNLLVMLMKYVQSEICKETISVLSYNPNSIRLISQCQNLNNSMAEQPINFTVQSDVSTMSEYRALAECHPYDIKYSWTVIKAFNNHLSKAMPYIQFSKCRESQFISGTNRMSVTSTIGDEISAIRELIMCSIKSELSQKITQKTSLLRDSAPKIVVQRLKIKEGERKNIVSAKQKDEFMITKAYEQIKQISPALLRPFKPKGAEPYLSFEVVFKGENVMGQAGPYRQFFTDLTNELHPSRNSGLFIMSPNKNKYMVNPKATNSYQLGLYEFIGVLMGCSIRTGAHLALDMPQMVWRQLVGQDISMSDLEKVDERFCDFITHIQECPDEQSFAQIDVISGQPLYWVGTLSDSTQIELAPNGKEKIVEYKERKKYINRLIEQRVKESALQIKAIRRGISQMLPQPYLNCLSGADLEALVCGKPKVDIDLLKKHTKYAGGLTETSKRIVFFWEVLRSMSEVDRLRFIKFCWGQERLPVNSQEFERNNIRFMIKPTINDSSQPDKQLPRADTCFFNIELPDYSSVEIMRNKIMLAIYTDCDSMNAEERHEEHQMMEDMESSFEQDNEEEQNHEGEQW